MKVETMKTDAEYTGPWVKHGQQVFYYGSPSSPPLPAIALVYNEGFRQTPQFKVSLLVYPTNPQKQDHKIPVKFYVAQAFHRDHPSRKVMNDTSFWIENPADPSARLESLEARVANIEKIAKAVKDK